VTKSKRKKIAIGILTLAFIGTSSIGFVVAEQSSKSVKEISPSATTILYDDQGKEIGNIHAIEDRRPVKLSQVPQNLQDAFIATEDNRFYSHMGVDPKGVFRALYANITGGTVSEGGSTITQQLAKNAYLTQEQTITRKIKEAVLALWLEHKYSKK
jgi:penicillin-binding protein 1A